MKKIILILATILLLTSPMTVLASDALYRGIVRVTNTDAGEEDVSTVFALDSDSLVSNSFANASLHDVAMKYGSTGIPFMPGHGANPWVFWIDSIGATQNKDYSLYTGGASAGIIRYFPDDTGMTVPNTLTLGAGNDWEIETAGWVKTIQDDYVDRNIVYKQDAFRTYIDGATNITSKIETWSDTEDLAPSGVGSETNISQRFPDTGEANWEDVLTNDGDTSYITEGLAPYKRDLYACTDSSVSSGTIDKVRIYFAARDLGVGGVAKTAVLTNGFAFDGVEVNVAPAAYDEYYTEYVDNPQTTVDWTWADVDAMEIGVSTNWAVAGCRVTQVFAKVYYTIPEASVTATGIANGEYTVKTWLVDGFLYLSVSTTPPTVPDPVPFDGTVSPNNNPWAFFENGAMPYVEYATVDVAGVPVSRWEWEYGTTFYDSEAGGNHATPNFRDTSSDPHISAELISFMPISQSRVSTFSLYGISAILSGVPGDIPNLYTDLDTEGNTYEEKLPGAEVINELLDEGGIPRAAWWFPFLFLGIGIIGILAYGATTMTFTQNGSIAEGQIDGSLLTMCIVVEVLLAVFGIINPIPLWPAILFPIPAIALILSRKHYSWG